MINRIVTRGMGTSASRMITRGYGGKLKEILVATFETVKKIVGGTKRKIYELEDEFITITVTLVEVNGEYSQSIIKGTLRVIVHNSTKKTKILAEHLATKIKSVCNDIRVFVNLLK